MYFEIDWEVQPYDKDLRNMICECHCGDTVPLMDGFDHCIIGVVSRHTEGTFVVYDREKVIEELMKHDMTWEDAADFHGFNQDCAWVGDQTWAFLDLFHVTKPEKTPMSMKSGIICDVCRGAALNCLPFDNTWICVDCQNKIFRHVAKEMKPLTWREIRAMELEIMKKLPVSKCEDHENSSSGMIIV